MFILTEKPSVAKDIATALGNFSKKDGYYERGNDVIVHALGHLFQLCGPEDYDESLKKWQLETLPIIPSKMKYIPIPATKKVFKNIQYCFANYPTDNFILATDAGREGELIGALVLEKVNFKDYASAKRFWVSEGLTPQVVITGLNNAKPLHEYEKYKNEGYARQHADWLVGMNVTRLLTSKANTLLTFGRVQTAVLNAIYEREKLIKNFNSEKYYELEVVLSNYSMFLLSNDSVKIASNDAILEAAKKILKEGEEVFIQDVLVEQKKENPPQLLNITGLQKICAKKYGYSAKKTLQIAQSLYEELKCLSYPRTPSTVLGNENVDLYRDKYESLKGLYPALSRDCQEELISENYKRLFDSTKLEDHHALIPLDNISSTASEEQKNVFFVVLETFFTVIKKPFTYEQITVFGECKELKLKGSGKNIIERGWKESVETDCQYFQIPEKNTKEKIIKQNLLEKKTQPPKYFTEATLLAMMENPKREKISENTNVTKLASLGTPATRGDIIDTLVKRNYLKREKKSLLITEKGSFLIEQCHLLPDINNMISLDETTNWEIQLKENPYKFLESMKEYISQSIQNSKKVNLESYKQNNLTCPLCGHEIRESEKNYYCSDYKNGCTFSIWKKIAHSTVSISDVQMLLTGKKTKEKKFKNKEGKEFSAALILKEGQVKFVFK